MLTMMMVLSTCAQASTGNDAASRGLRGPVVDRNLEETLITGICCAAVPPDPTCCLVFTEENIQSP